jgi:dCMP deaminase
MTDPRPGWDEYFIHIADAVATRGDCTRRQVGAVIVKDHRIVATGYNGAPAGARGCLSASACPRGKHYAIDNPVLAHKPACACGQPVWPCPDAVDPGSGYDTGPGACIAVHAEANALLYADRADCEDATLYITDEPCEGCKRLIRAAGIARVRTPVLTWDIR